MHECAVWSGPSLFAFGIRACFMRCALYVNSESLGQIVDSYKCRSVDVFHVSLFRLYVGA